MEEEKEKQNFIEDNIIILSKQTLDAFLKEKNPSDLIGLYTFYYYTAKWQKTNIIKCSISYAMKGLKWTKERVIKNKKRLVSMGLIENKKTKNKKGQITGWYIKINYIWKKETIQKNIKNQRSEKPDTGLDQIVENPTTNALSANRLNALSVNNKNNSDYPIIASQGSDNSNRKKKKDTDLEETQSKPKHSATLKRKDFRVKPEVYKELTDAYEKYKGIKLQGAEYGEVKRAIKTMLYSGRTKKNIIDFMKFCSEIGENDKDLEWLKNWTILTIKRKMPEFLAGKIKKKVDNAEEEEEEYKIVKFYGKSATKN